MSERRGTDAHVADCGEDSFMDNCKESIETFIEQLRTPQANSARDPVRRAGLNSAQVH